jgi:hypothetical protein
MAATAVASATTAKARASGETATTRGRSATHRTASEAGICSERFGWAGFEVPGSSVPLLPEAILEVTCHGVLVGFPT